MLAARLHSFGDLRMEDVPSPAVGPDEVRIGVAAVQSSVTEALLAMGEPITLHDHLAKRLAAGPVLFGGHEFAGVVTECGAEVDRWRPGDRVTAIETVPGPSGMPEYLGFTREGAFAEEVVVPAANVVAIPPGVSASAAAGVQPLAGALHGHAALHVQPGEALVVIGCGVMGLLEIQVARHGNAGLIIAVGRSEAKRELAARLGADVVLDARSDDVAAEVAELTAGLGADVVVEAAGGPPGAGLGGDSTLELALRCVRRGGRVLLEAVYDNKAHFPLDLARERVVNVLHPNTGSGGYSASSSVFDHALRLIARGDVDTEALVTHRLQGLESIPEAVAMSAGKHQHNAINPPQVFTDLAWDTVNRDSVNSDISSNPASSNEEPA
ncbi:zinc-dependent alcohol dehydrogenase [Enemella sp. A6]|uniref:zinc-dependent alcohol dehydrogenase n=1 Tax=Enemella sp. A6 TaxID=3440152 RepID=UPI003EB7B923